MTNVGTSYVHISAYIGEIPKIGIKNIIWETQISSGTNYRKIEKKIKKMT